MVYGCNWHKHSDERCLEEFEQCVYFDYDHYVAKLPWKSTHPDLPTNYYVSECRLFSNLKSLPRKSDALSQYNDLIKSQLTSGFIEQVVRP